MRENLASVEWIILEEIAKGVPQEELTRLLKDNRINWGELIEQAIYHKLLPMLSWNLLKENTFELVPPFLNQYFKNILDLNRHKTNIQKAETVRIVHALNKKNIKFAITKGMILESTLYNSDGYRYLSDIDFMINADDKNNVLEIMDSIGYKVGMLDWRTHTIKELSREKHLIYTTTNDHVPEHLIEIDDPIIRYVSVGFAMSFSWSGSPYNVDISKAFEKLIYNKVSGYEEALFPSLNHAYHFVFVVIHLFKHAWLDSMQKWKNDVNLIKFADVMRLWNKFDIQIKEEIFDIIEQFSIEEPLFWVARHTDDLFGTNITKELKLTNNVNPNILHKAYDRRGNAISWKGTMRNRLQLKERKSIF